MSIRVWLVGLLLTSSVVYASELKLTEKGRSDYCIVVGEKASEPERYAAQELQHWLKEMSGAELAIKTDTQGMNSPEIIVGVNGRLQGLLPDLDVKALGTEGYIIKNIGQNVVIVGGSPRGTLYGVYGLLEDHLGCRWFTPTVSKIPHKKTVTIPAINEVQKPILEYREPFTMDCFDGDWCARNRMNSSTGRFEPRHGGHVRFGAGMFVHTFDVLMPPKDYFDQHPEYYAEVEGKRVKERTQLCCTNPDVIRIVTEETLKRIASDPDAFVYSVSQNDWDNHCTCVNCKALADLEGSQMAPVLQLVNKVAEAVEQKYPGKAIETLAYQWTRKAPKSMRPRPNVIIRLCSIECCFMHPLATCDSPANVQFRKDAEAWARVADRLWVWDYVTNFHEYMLPHPNLRVLNDNIEFFEKNNVRGIFEQDNYQSFNGDFSPLGGYMAAKFLWNPKYAEDAAMNEFLEGVYGKKPAKYIREYIDMLHDKVAKENLHSDIWHSASEVSYLTPDVMERGLKLWNKAEKAARKDPALLERVQIARLSYDYAWIEKNRAAAYAYDHDKWQASTSPEFAERVKRFFEVARKANVTRMAESSPTLDAYEQEMGPVDAQKRTFTPVEPTDVKTTQGVKFACYTGGWSKLPDFSTLQPVESGIAEKIGVAPAKRDKEYGLQFDGYVQIKKDGVYAFYLDSNDGSRMDIAGVKVDNDGLHRTSERSALVGLKKGFYPIHVDYFQSGAGQELTVYYEGPGIKKQAIPASAFYHEAE